MNFLIYEFNHYNHYNDFMVSTWFIDWYSAHCGQGKYVIRVSEGIKLQHVMFVRFLKPIGVPFSSSPPHPLGPPARLNFSQPCDLISRPLGPSDSSRATQAALCYCNSLLLFLN